MGRFFEKITKKTLFIICIVIAGCFALPGLLNIARVDEIGSFLYAEAFAGLFVFLGLCYLDDKNDKKFLIIVLLLGGLFVDGLTPPSNCFLLASYSSGVKCAIYVFNGLAGIAVFGACVCQLLPMLFDKMPKKILHQISTIAYLTKVGLSFISLFLSIFDDFSFFIFMIELIAYGGECCTYFILAYEMNKPENGAITAKTNPSKEVPTEEPVAEEPVVEPSVEEPTAQKEAPIEANENQTQLEEEPVEETQGEEMKEEPSVTNERASSKISITDKMEVLEATPIVDDNSKESE